MHNGSRNAASPKWLVVGAGGQVGTQIALQISQAHGPDSVLRTSRQSAGEAEFQLDLANLSTPNQAAKFLDSQDLGCILCVGGMTHVDGCESEPDLAFRINARGPGALAAYALQRHLPFAYFSTDYIFSGFREDPGPYPEDATPNPLNVYGKSKLEGEAEVLSAHPRALVLRTTVVYGPDRQEKNFIYALVRNLSQGSKMRVPADQISTPTYNEDLASATIGLVNAGASGVYHLAGPEAMDRLVFAQTAAKVLGLDASQLEGFATNELSQPATRPLYAGLATDKLQQNFPNLRMRGPSEGVQAFEKTLKVPVA